MNLNIYISSKTKQVCTPKTYFKSKKISNLISMKIFAVLLMGYKKELLSNNSSLTENPEQMLQEFKKVRDNYYACTDKLN